MLRRAKHTQKDNRPEYFSGSLEMLYLCLKSYGAFSEEHLVHEHRRGVLLMLMRRFILSSVYDSKTGKDLK